MTACPASLFRRAWLPTLAAILFPSSYAFAQFQDDRAPFAILGGFMIFMLLIILAAYVYTSLAVQTIANKTNTENGWLAWIPIVNIFLLVMIARKPIWWFFLCLIPLVNIVMLVIIWMAVAEARGKPSWWGILLIVPVVGIIVPGYLAWSD